MKALQITAPGKSEVKEVPMPAPGPKEVLVRVLAVTTCPHWDIHVFSGKPMFPGVPFTYPYMLGQPGHEACGEVVAVGDEVRGIAVGERVSVWHDRGHAVPGCYAQYVAVDAISVIPVPASLAPQACAPLELAMCASAHILLAEQLDAIAGRRVGVLGLGPAGLVFVQLLRAAGALEIVGIDPLLERRGLAQELGATRVLDPDEVKRGAIPYRMQQGSLHATFDCAGNADAVHGAMQITDRLVVLFAVQRDPYVFGPQFWGGLILAGAQSHTREAAEYAAERLRRRQLNLGVLVSDTMRLEDYAKAIPRLEERSVLKIAFLPHDGP